MGVAFLAQKFRFQFQSPVEVETTHTENLGDGDIGILSPVDFGHGIHLTDTFFQSIQFGGRNQICFVQDQHISKGDLFLGFAAVIQVEKDMFGIDQCDNAVQTVFLFDFLVREKGLGHGTGIGQAGGFDQHVIEFVFPFVEAAENADQVAADGATDTAIVHFKNFFVAADDQFLVHADFAEFVFDHGDAFAVLFGQDAVEEGGFSGSQEAGQDSNRNRVHK